MKRIIYSLAIAASALSFNSCTGDLATLPLNETDKTAQQAYQKLEDFEKGLAYIYGSYSLVSQNDAGSSDIAVEDAGQSELLRQYVVLNEMSVDALKCAWGDSYITDTQNATWSATPNAATIAVYTRCMVTVTRANEFLVQSKESSVEGVAGLRAEARFLRAYAYYMLLDLYGNPPFALEENIGGELPKQIDTDFKKGRKGLFEWIESELKDLLASEDMPEVGEVSYPRVTKGAAQALLARMYLNAEVYTGTAQWAKAAEYAQKIMNSAYKLHTQGSHDAVNNKDWSAYQMLFMGDNGENGAQCEAILPLLQDGLTTTSWGTSLFLMASTFKADMTLVGTATNGTTELWAGNRARPDFVAKFFPNGDAPAVTTAEMVAAAGDDRALLWGKDRTLNVDDVADFATGYSVAKFTNYYTSGTAKHSQFPDTDYFLMRAAEAYLTFAEAATRANGGSITAEAKAAIDAIRGRANATIKNTYSLNDILDEWSREFYYEGRRRIDLIRFGQFGGNGEYKGQWKGGVKEGTVFNTNLNIFAIPDTDLNANPNLVQNPGY